jgi:hypothetical protein
MLPGVQDAFATAWSVQASELITGFDSCAATRNFWRLEEHSERLSRKEAWKHNGASAGYSWLHVDQNWDIQPNLSSYQGALNIYAATERTGGTVLVPGSHKRFEEIFTKNQRKRGDFVMLDQPGDVQNYCSGARQIVCEAGDLLLWDSRVIHCNQSIDQNNQPAEHTITDLACSDRMLARLVAFVCMLPRAHLLEHPQREELSQRRRQFVMEGHTGPHHPIKVPAPTPDFWGYRSRCCAKRTSKGHLAPTSNSAAPPTTGNSTAAAPPTPSNSAAAAPPPYSPPAKSDPRWGLV